MEEVYARELRADGVHCSEEDLEAALAGAWRQTRLETRRPGVGPPNPRGDRYGGVRGEPEFWRSFLDRVRGRLDGGSVSAEAFARLASHFRDAGSWAVYDDVEETLDRLAERGLSLAVVSNWDSHLPALLEGLGLSGRFAAVLVSAIEETGKPEPEIFLRACARLSVAPAEALHVGDSLAEDYEGARAAGLSAVLLDRHDRHPEVAGRIRSLDELARSGIVRAPIP